MHEGRVRRAPSPALCLHCFLPHWTTFSSGWVFARAAVRHDSRNAEAESAKARRTIIESTSASFVGGCEYSLRLRPGRIPPKASTPPRTEERPLPVASRIISRSLLRVRCDVHRPPACDDAGCYPKTLGGRIGSAPGGRCRTTRQSSRSVRGTSRRRGRCQPHDGW